MEEFHMVFSCNNSRDDYGSGYSIPEVEHVPGGSEGLTISLTLRGEGLTISLTLRGGYVSQIEHVFVVFKGDSGEYPI
eukprot:Awhi_evm1s8083